MLSVALGVGAQARVARVSLARELRVKQEQERGRGSGSFQRKPTDQYRDTSHLTGRLGYQDLPRRIWAKGKE